MTRFYQLLQKSPRATFCHKKWRGLKFPQSSLSAVPDCITGLRLFVKAVFYINILKLYNQWFKNFKTEFRSLKWFCPHDYNFISKCRQSSLQNSYFFGVFHVSGGKQCDAKMCVCAWTTCFSFVYLSSAEAPSCHRERRKRKRAGDDGKGKEISPSHGPLRSCFLSLIAIFIGDTQRSLCGEERFCVVAIHTVLDSFFGTKSNYY